MDLLIFGVTHFILSGFVANHQSHPGCIFRPGAASQFAVDGALADLDTQVAEGIGLHPQGAQHQAFGIAADQRVVVQAVGGADRLGLELKLPGLASQTQGQALVPGHLLAFRLGGAGEDFFRDGFRQFGKIAEKCGHFGGQRRRRIHRCPQTLQGVGQQGRRRGVLDVHPAQRSLFSTADLTDLLQLRVAESIGGVAQASHQCRAFPLARVLRFADPGTVVVVSQSRGIGVGSLRMLDSVLPGRRVCLHFKQLTVQPQNLLSLMLVNT
ncbi:hypothetical protein D3C87_1136850 [compost metagenome]